MSALSVVITKLNTISAVTSVADGIYLIQAPQTAPLPYCLLHLVDSSDGAHLGGANKYYTSEIQVDSVSDDGIVAVDLGEAVITALNGVVKEEIGSFADVDILLGSSDFTEQLDGQNIFRRVTRYKVTWRHA